MTPSGAGIRNASGRESACGLIAQALAVSLVLVVGPSAPAVAIDLVTTTGLDVVVHPAEEIQARWLVRDEGRVWLRHPIAGEVELDSASFPWSDLVPVAVGDVVAALEALQGFQTNVQVEVFLLPGLPAGILGSFARRDAIFLAPGLGDQAAETVAYLVTHEVGHVLCWAAIDGRPERWDEYRTLRGLAPEGAGPVPHVDRHREIIAEDLRYLFGGPLATRSGTIENPGLPLPDAVAGLREWFVACLAETRPAGSTLRSSRVYPNPGRELVRIELVIDGDAAKASVDELDLVIYDIRGRLVRRLAGGQMANNRAIVVWDGTAADGRRAPAGPYLYRIRCADQSGSGRLLLIDR